MLCNEDADCLTPGKLDQYTNNELNEIINVNVFPNPIEHNLIELYYVLKSKSDLSIELYDIAGKWIAELEHKVNQEPSTYYVSYNTAHLPQGIYFYRINTDYGFVSGKIVKQ